MLGVFKGAPKCGQNRLVTALRLVFWTWKSERFQPKSLHQAPFDHQFTSATRTVGRPFFRSQRCVELLRRTREMVDLVHTGHNHKQWEGHQKRIYMTKLIIVTWDLFRTPFGSIWVPFHDLQQGSTLL